LIGFFFIPFIYHHFTGFFAGQDSWNALVENVTYGKNLWLFVFFLSNIALRIYGPVVGASQSWSVSIEEQFYLIWPWIVKFFHKSLIYVLIGIVIVMTVLNYNMERFDSHIARAVIYSFNIDFMAMGGIIAVLYRNNKVLARKLMTNKIVKIVILAATALHLFLPVSHFTLSLTFGLLILLLIENKVSIGMFSALGKWSYGIYMYHPLVVYFSFALLTQLGITSGAGSILGQYVLITGGTIGISYFSYQYIELFFLKLKRRFSPIVSGSL
jgi:peptidoglycan/LPS O-acetylase OafA/YrhL